MEHLSYSLDLAPREFRLFPEIKSALKRRIFQDAEDIQKKCDYGTESFPQQEFHKCFQHWKCRWVKSVAAQVEYFEGDPSQ